MHYTIDSRGQRSSTLTAFLPSHLVRARRKHLHICTRSMVLKIELTGAEGSPTALGVHLQARDGHSPSRFVRARREIIISAGPIGSPQLLMLR